MPSLFERLNLSIDHRSVRANQATAQPAGIERIGKTVGNEANRQRHSALVVAAKPPLVGEVKTRLCPPLTLPQARRLYESLLEDIVTKMSKFHAADLWVAFTPKGEEYFRRNFGVKIRLLSQRGNDLGERLHNIFVDLSRSGYQETIVTDSDSPTVPLSSIAQAYELLNKDETDVVLGPSRDGGYYLVGLKSPTKGLFNQIPWSTEGVLEKTLERASMLKLKVGLLPAAYDIDMDWDLRQLWKDLERSPELQGLALRTHAYLKVLFGDSGLDTPRIP